MLAKQITSTVTGAKAECVGADASEEDMVGGWGRVEFLISLISTHFQRILVCERLARVLFQVKVDLFWLISFLLKDSLMIHCF